MRALTVRRLAACMAATCGLLAPGTAMGATASVDSDGVLQVDAASLSFSNLNSMNISYFGTAPTGVIVIEDIRLMDAGPGCMPLHASAVQCQDSHSLVSATVNLREEADTLRLDADGADALPASLPFTVAGGTGGDTIRGGRGNDVLAGDAGADFIFGRGGDDKLGKRSDRGRDRFYGGNGADKLIARDGTRDREINCGGGNDRRARVDRRLDPEPERC